MANKYLELNLATGKVARKEATVVSAGAANANEIPALDGTGRLDPSVLPLGVGPDITIVEASENIGAGKYVNIYNDAGNPKARLADSSNGRDAHGFTKNAYTTGQQAAVYFEGPNENVSGKTVGARQYLGTLGDSVEAPVSTGIHQFLGYAISATSINTDIDDLIVL